jgi:RNA polymerase sigma-70 factor, ECF subfamily
MENINNISDEKLVEFVRSKDQELYIYIVKRYEAKLMRYAEYLIGDKEKASDAIQETFIKAFVNLNGFNVKQKFSSWIYRIAHNETVNIVKKYKRESFFSEQFDIADKTSIEDEFSKKEIVSMVYKCLSGIPIIYSEVLVLYFIDELSYEEISEILKIPMGTVAIRLNRSKGIMKKICQKNN